MKKAVVIGGNSGIGLSLTLSLLDKGYDQIYSYGLFTPNSKDIPSKYLNNFYDKVLFKKINLEDDIPYFPVDDSVNTLIITSGFGRVERFENLLDKEIENLLKVNCESIIKIIKKFYKRIKSKNNFYSLVMGSIAGHIVSPLFSVYGAAKAGLCSFIQNLNIELAADGFDNRILEVSPGSIKGTNFNGGKNDISSLLEFSNDLLNRTYKRETLFIPDFDKIYKNVIKRNNEDITKFGLESFKYKIENNRVSSKPQLVIGYLSGTFDLFHIGHLNILRNAKQQCDYLIVGVHESGAWKGKETFIPFKERAAIVESIKYVDKVIKSFKEDSDAWEKYHYNKLFVGSDYKGAERFRKYEDFFKDKDVEIIYFPYTKGTSSTKLRNKISH